MRTRLRYGLLVTGIVLFIVAVPLIALFITGRTYDFKNHRWIKTGIIAVTTNPTGAKIYLNGKLSATSNASLRFIRPGDYLISIQKDGYFEWHKNLAVQGQFVTAAQNNADAVYLFRSSPERTVLRSGIYNFFSGNKKIVYLTQGKLFLADISDPAETQELTINSAATDLQIISNRSETLFLLYDANSYFVFDAKHNKLIEISAAVTAISNTQITTWKFSDSDDLFFLYQKQIYQADWRKAPLPSVTPIMQNILAFTPGEGVLYVIAQNAQQDRLVRVDLPDLTQTQLSAIAVPSANNIQIFLSGQNQLFILADQSLFTLGQNNLTHIADFVKYIRFYDQQNKILIGTNNEISLYDTYGGSNSYITRSSQEIIDPQASLSSGWAFFLNDGRLQSIEFDNRDHQNNYTFASVTAGAKFSIDAGARNLFLLNNGTLEYIKVQ